MYRLLAVVAALGVAWVLILTTGGCAVIVPPSGGPKDTLPPVLVKALPNDSTLNMPPTGVRIVLSFDEYIQPPSNASQEIVMNPVPKYPPIYEQKLKTLTIRIKDTLEPKTTYTFSFGNAIKDVDEGNILHNFRYIFSTGKGLDSGRLNGRVTIARTSKVDTTLIVVLHRHLDDSAVAKEAPRYMATLDSVGRFKFRNIAVGTYAIYALKDEGDKKYRDKTLAFAFYDTPITVTAGPSDSIFLHAYKEEAKPKAKPVTPIRTSKAKKKEEQKLHVSTDLQSGKQDLLLPLTLTYDQPIKTFDSTQIQLTDTFFHPFPIHITVKDTTAEKFEIHYPWKEDSVIRLIIGKKAAIDTSGVMIGQSDTITFRTRKESEYGSLVLRFQYLDLTKHPVIQFVQEDKVVDSAAVTQYTMTWNLFKPGDYELRVLYDTNQNGTWDPGSFFGVHKQPELVVPPRRPKIKVRGNGWENEYDVVL